MDTPKICPNCGGYFADPHTGQTTHVVCNDCGAIHFLYEPLPHQTAFHKDSAKYKMYAGGYGSGKTHTACWEIIRHVLTTPNGTTLIGAATLPQLEQTAQKEFFMHFPEDLITHHSKQKNYVDIANGHRVIFRPLDDEGKARSLNLTAFWIEEASEVNFEYFVQLTTRLRSTATKEHLGVLSTNPDMGWVKNEFLLKSNRIFNSEVNYYRNQDEVNPQYVTYIAPTKLNPYLPPDFYETTAKGRPDWWVRRFLEGSFENRSGLVYPLVQDNIVTPFEIPKQWERIIGVDFGILDPTTMLIGAIDPDEGIVYLYKEYYKTNETVPVHAKAFDKMVDDVPFGRMRMPIADPSGKQRGKFDGRSLFDHYGEYGWYFKAGDNRILSGIAKVSSYYGLGRIKIFDTMKNFIEESLAYKFKEQDLNAEKNLDDKPIDRMNHLMDSLRYMIQELPDDPDQLMNKSYGYDTIVNNKKQANLPHQLQDDEEGKARDWFSYY